MSKQNAINTWNDGLNKDLSPAITPNTILTDNLNGTFITYNGNEFSLQNDMGNVYTSRLSDGFYPIGMIEYGGIIYIASVSNGYQRYATVKKPDDIQISDALDEIYNYVKQQDANISFSKNEALVILSEKGLLITNLYIETVIREALSGSEYEVSFRDDPSTRFELGSFPSLDPKNLKLSDVEDSSINYSQDYAIYDTSIDYAPQTIDGNVFITKSGRRIGKKSLKDKSIDSKSLEEQSFEYVYRPLHNLIVTTMEYVDDTISSQRKLAPFSTSVIGGYDLSHPVNIEIQPSYDGSVNIILNDNKNVPRMINSGFAVLPNGKGKFIVRNQGNKTNYYDETYADTQTRLINFTESFTTIDLGQYNSNEDRFTDGIRSGGSLKGGNYTFYLKLEDEDGNQTDVISESGIISVFKGIPGEPHTISGAFQNEITDKMIVLTISNIDTSYSKMHLYYTREYCDANGYRLTECKSINTLYKIIDVEQQVVISGVEETEDISIEELNILYHAISSAKTAAQQQNMLFLGNIEMNNPDSPSLQNISYEIVVGTELGTSVGAIDPITYNVPKSEDSEYYDPQNIYYYLGYWPNELYRFGVVYIKADGSTTQVYNLKGAILADIDDNNYKLPHINNIVTDDNIFIKNTKYGDNLVGVFKTPNVDVLEEKQPICFSFKFNNSTILKLQELGIIGYFIVRQKRIPITICQGFGVGIDKVSFIPMIQMKTINPKHEVITEYYAESFITGNDEDNPDESRRLVYDPVAVTSGDTVHYEVGDIKFYLCVTNEKYNCGTVIPSWSKCRRYRCRIVGPWSSKPMDRIDDAEELDHVYYDTGFIGPLSKTLHPNMTDAQLNAPIWFRSREEVIQLARDWMANNSTQLMRDNFFDDAEKTITRNAELVKLRTTSVDNTRDRYITTHQLQSAGLISLEAMTNPMIQSALNGIEYNVITNKEGSVVKNGPMFVVQSYKAISDSNNKNKLTYLPEGTALKYINNKGFSNQSGDGINSGLFGFLGYRDTSNAKADNIVRGKFTPYIAVLGDGSENAIGCLCDIRIPTTNNFTNEITTRANDNSEFYAVSNRMILGSNVDVYRGDCFVNTVTVRMHRNFIDSTAPIADEIVKPDSWRKYYHGLQNVAEQDDSDKSDKTQWDRINISDLNTVSLGHWLTFRCLASSNLGLRSEDTTNVTEMALLGNARSFYPLIGASTSTGMKLADSILLNDGYNATVGRKRNVLKQDVPFDKNEFSTRIIFSNISVTDSFTNGYRVFQGISFNDYTKQFGAIIKLVPWGNNLFIAFEHGLAIAPINEKALMQTTTEQTIHIYGHGVLPNQLSIISPDFGTIWADSVIRTPIGIYGVDTSAKKIWRYSDSKGLETLSDMKLQRFLNDNINLELNKQELLGYTNVKSHYNNYKGDVMFTFYNTDNNSNRKEWNICYNERQGLWVTRYDWIPVFSANIDNAFYSMPLLQNNDSISMSIWKHGRTGMDNLEFRPTLWYGTQHPFEFEFVVNTPSGLHKIFENLMIVSNNVQPTSFEFRLIGDDYLFNRSRIYHDNKNIYGNTGEDKPYIIDVNGFSKDNFHITNFKPMFYNASVEYDPVLDEYILVVNQICKNKETYGVRLGNIQYKEDGWYTNIEPLRYNLKLNNSSESEFNVSDKFGSAKLRDKWLKIRIKYTGDRLAIINAVTTTENLSYA